MKFRWLLVFPIFAAGVCGQVLPQRLLQSGSEPQNWLSYSGSYLSQRYSQLDQVTPA